MKRAFKHASHERRENDAILARCELDSGHVGWGEGLPRDYVTGDTIDSAWAALLKTFEESDAADALWNARFNHLSDAVGLLQNWKLAGFEGDTRGCLGNAARCPVELAILDAVGQATQTPLDQLGTLIEGCAPVATTNDHVRYGLVVSPSSIPKAIKWGLAARLYSFPDLKVKLAVEGVDERKTLAWLRDVAGRKVPIRADCNEAWAPAEIADRLKALGDAATTLESIEQPCPHESVEQLAAIREQIPPVVLDESLCCLPDAQRAVTGGYGEIFNLRVSKCGGLIPSFQLAAFAANHNRQYQIGCQVGETGILTAAGRALACGLKNVRRLEGSYDRHLVIDNLTHEDLTFGHGGKAPRLAKGGLGITVNETAVSGITIQSKHWSP